MLLYLLQPSQQIHCDTFDLFSTIPQRLAGNWQEKYRSPIVGATISLPQVSAFSSFLE